MSDLCRVGTDADYGPSYRSSPPQHLPFAARGINMRISVPTYRTRLSPCGLSYVRHTSSAQSGQILWSVQSFCCRGNLVHANTCFACVRSHATTTIFLLVGQPAPLFPRGHMHLLFLFPWESRLGVGVSDPISWARLVLAINGLISCHVSRRTRLYPRHTLATCF